MINTWIRANANQLAQIKKFLTECEYKPEFDEFPLRPIQRLLNGSEAEINRLQHELQMLKEGLKKADTPKSKPDTPAGT